MESILTLLIYLVLWTERNAPNAKKCVHCVFARYHAPVSWIKSCMSMDRDPVDYYFAQSDEYGFDDGVLVQDTI